MRPRKLSFQVVYTLIALAPALWAVGAEDNVQDAPASSAPEAPIVLRISKALFDDLTQQELEIEMPIDTEQQGVRVSGTATGGGSIRVALARSAEHAEFTISLEGTAVAIFAADIGPVAAHARSDAILSTQTRVLFDGVRFSRGATTVSSRNDTEFDRVCTRHGGPVSWLVRRVAWRVIDRNQSEIDQLVEVFTQERVKAKIEAIADEVISELNRTTKFEETVIKYFPETASWVYHLETTEGSIVAAAGPPNARIPALPAVEEAALLEVWLRTTPLEATLLQIMVDWNFSHDLLREFLSEDDATALAKEISFATVDDWSVIRVGKPSTQTVEARTTK